MSPVSDALAPILTALEHLPAIASLLPIAFAVSLVVWLVAAEEGELREARHLPGRQAGSAHLSTAAANRSRMPSSTA